MINPGMMISDRYEIIDRCAIPMYSVEHFSDRNTAVTQNLLQNSGQRHNPLQDCHIRI